MSTKSIDTHSEAALPFFAHLLSGQNEQSSPQQEGGGAPTYHCLDSPCTKKYPSDADEPTSPTWDR